MSEQNVEPTPEPESPVAEAEPEARRALDEPEPTPEPEPEPELLEIPLRDTTIHVFADARDDFEILDEVQRIQEGDMVRLTVLMRRMMPEADRLRALDVARGTNGRVTLDAAMDLMGDIFKGMHNPN